MGGHSITNKNNSSKNDFNELSENIIVKQQSNDPQFNLLDSIRENDIKGNKNINIAEIYSNRNNTANLVDNSNHDM